MIKIDLLQMHLENFKIFKDKVIDFGNLTTVSAQNKSGKSSIADAFFWVMFGKSSTGKSEGKEFRPRRFEEIDGIGVDIDHVDVSVELVLRIDGVEVVLKKTQHQNWPKKRGSTIEVHESDSNIFSWNNVEITSTEFSRRISEIVTEEIFKLVTNPFAFMKLSKDEKRNLLMKLVGLTEEQIIFELEGYEDLKAIINTGRTIVEIEATTKKSVSLMTEKKEEMASAINERARDIVDLDVAEKELQKNSLLEQIADKDKLLEDNEKIFEQRQKASDNILQLEFDINDISRKAHESIDNQKKALNAKLNSIDASFNEAFRKQSTVESDIKIKNEAIARNEAERTRLGTEYKTIISEIFDESKWVFDENSIICPICEREFEADQVGKIKSEFETKKSNAISSFEIDKKNRTDAVVAKGFSMKNVIEADNAILVELSKQLEQIKADKLNANAEKTKAMEELAKIPSEVDLPANQEYITLCAERDAKKKALDEMVTGADYRTQIKAEKIALESELKMLELEFEAYRKSDDARDRVAELKKELSEKVQEIANQERIQIMCGEFQLDKDSYLQNSVNEKFSTVRFQLYRNQKNGGHERVCDVYVASGAPYGENTTSGCEKISAGLEIIKVVSDIIGVKASVIIDNAESINDFNIPKMDCQVVLLQVTKDIEMKVEVE